MPSVGGTVGLAAANAAAGLFTGWMVNKWFKEDWAERIAFIEHRVPSFVSVARTVYPPGTPLFANVEIDVTNSQSFMGEPGWTPNRTRIEIYSLKVSDQRPPASSKVVDKTRWMPGYMSETTRVSFSFPVPKTM